MVVTEIDLGSDHFLRFTEWDPDPELNPQWADLPPEQPGQHHGAIVRHRPGPHPPSYLRDAEWCAGGITFDTPRARRGSPDDRSVWQVQSWDPLTINPSVLCDCGDHGFIRQGRWESA